MPKRKSSVGAPPKEALERGARELVIHLDRAMRRLVLAGDEHEPHESFSRSEITVLDTLGAEGAMTMGAMAARVRLPLSTASRVVDRLVSRGMLERERPVENRRIVRVTLAESGRRLYRAALAGRIAGAERMLAGLAVRERQELIRLFQKIAESIAEDPAR